MLVLYLSLEVVSPKLVLMSSRVAAAEKLPFHGKLCPTPKKNELAPVSDCCVSPAVRNSGVRVLLPVY